MKHYHLSKALNFVFILIFLTSLIGTRPVQAASLPSPQPSSIKTTIQADSPTPLPPADNFQYGYNSNTGELNFVGGTASNPLMASSGELNAQSVENSGQAVLDRFAPDFGVKDPAKDLRLARTQTSESGDTLRYQQEYNGVPVMGGEMLVNSDAQGNVLSLNGKVSPDLAMDSTQPAISSDQAIQAALAGMKTWYNLGPDELNAGQPVLWIYDPRIFTTGDQPPVLVWRLDVQATGGSTPVNELVLVDGQTGSIALHFNQIDTSWQNLGTQPQIDPSATASAIVEETTTQSPTATATPAPASTETPAETATAQPTPTGKPTQTAIPAATSTVPPAETATQTPADILTLGPTPTVELATATPATTSTSQSQANHPGEVNTQAAATWYVANTGSDSNSCSTPISPCNTINGVIGKASNGDTIKVAVGIYTQTSTDVVNIYKSVDLSGGWNTGFSNQSGFSTIDGQNVQRGIFINSGVVTTIRRFIIKNGNPPGSNQKGGAIYAGDTGSLTIIESSITHNAAWNGGAIYSDGQQKLTLLNTTIGDNSASNAGGGIYLNNTPQFDLNNVTIANNRNKVHHGGGISLLEPLNSSYTINMRNSILAQNTSIPTSGASTADDCWSSVGGKTNPVAVQSGGYNLFEKTQGCTFNSTSGDITGQNPKLQAAQLAGFYPLAPDSPALDAGNPAVPGSGQNACETVDQLGTARPLDGNQDGSAVCDIGAYEADSTAPATIHITASTGTSQLRIIHQDFLAFSAIVTDQIGAPLSNIQVTFTAPSEGASGTFSGTNTNQTTALTDNNGVATSSILTANDQAGQFVVTASVSGIDKPAQFQLENYIQEPASLTASSGTPQIQEIHLAYSAFVVTVKDQHGILLAGVPVTFTAPSDGASGVFSDTGANQTQAVTNSSGVASSALLTANDQAGQFIVTASVTETSATAQFQLENYIPAPTKLTASSGTPQVRSSHHAYAALSVKVTDQTGKLLTDVLVTFTAPSDGASGTFADTSNNQTVANTNSGGVATASIFTANDQGGQFVVTASVSGVDSTAQFQLENYIPVPARLTSTGGSGLYASSLRPFDARQSAYLVDTRGNPMDGAVVTFTAPSTGASGTFPDGSISTNVVAGTDGSVDAPVFTANTTQGTYTMRASTAGLAQTLSFNLTNRNVYVSPDGVDIPNPKGNECAYPDAPCKTLSRAIYEAHSNVTIFIQDGFYSEAPITVNLGRLILSGGWNAGFTTQVGQSTIEAWNGDRYATIPQDKILDLSYVTLNSGITNNGTLNVWNSALLKNAGIANNGYASLLNTTVSGSSPCGNYEFCNGPFGILNSNNISLKNVTISGVNGNGFINGSNIYSPKATIQNSIISGNTKNCYLSGGSLTTLGHNIFGSAPACQGGTFTPASTDQVNVDPKLSALVNYSYHALLPGSPAIDAIDPNDPTAACPPTDQRGVARPAGGMCDIGAFEYTPPGAPVRLLALSTFQTTGPGTIFPSLLQAQVLDANGSPVQGATITFTAPASGISGTFADSQGNTTQAITDENGIATATEFTANSETGFYTVTASLKGANHANFPVGNFTPARYIDAANGRDYLYPSGNTLNDCHSVIDPCKSVNNALQHVVSGDVIKITQGAYTSSSDSDLAHIVLIPLIYLSGGWESSFIQQNGRTVLQGSSSVSNQTGIYIWGGSKVTVDHIDFLNLYNDISITGGQLVLEDSSLQFTSNGITIDNDSGAQLTNLTFTGTQYSGAAISNSGMGVVLTNSTFSNASVAISNRGGLTISNTTVNDNGSGIYNSGKLNLTNSSITNNSSGVSNTGELNLTNTTISANGYGISNNGGKVYLTNVTLTRNSFIGGKSGDNFVVYGAAINNPTGSITIQNTILAHNQSISGRDCYGKITSLGHNLIGDATGCLITPGSGDLIGDDKKPIDPHLADLADNGGGSLTNALLPGSPAIDAGDPSACPVADQRGVSRPVGNACDIGAYEGTGTGTAAPQILIYTAGNSSNGPVKYFCPSPQPGCSNLPGMDAVKANLFSTGFYQFLIDHFNRISLDGADMAIIVNIQNNLHPNNSYWDGYQVVFSDGFPQADDVVAHELTHGLTRYSSNLFYYYQSGAISESMSDLFGEYFGQTNGLGNDSPAVKWLLGEDLPGGAVRSMSNPPAYKNPDKMTSSYYYQGPNDNGGVHTNSGINNKAVYLMVDGGSFNGKTVAPLGWEKTGALYYYVETRLLTSGSDYSDFYNALVQACSVLTDTDGITTADCQQVRNALDAVQMNQSPSSSYNPEAAVCPKGETQDPASLFADDFENGASQWTFTSSTGNPHWGIASGYAADGQYALFGNDYDPSKSSNNQVSDTNAAMTNGIAIPANADTFLFFKHSFGFEYGVLNGKSYYFDGGVLEYTIDNGETWHDAKPLFSTGQNYKGNIYNTTATGFNPLRGRNAFVGESHGYVSSSYALKTLAGKTVRFRWRMGTDYTGYYLGWLVDDVSIYTCVGNPGVPAMAAPTNGSLVNGYQPTLDWKGAANADHYEVEIATDVKFNNVVLPISVVSGLTSEYSISSDLLPNTTYYWHARAVNQISVKSNWSSTWSFRTRLPAPEMTAPANGDTLHLLLPIFIWKSIPGADSYTLVISASSSYSPPVVNARILAGTTTYTPIKDLPAGKKLYGRIMANGVNPSLWTTFTITTPLPPSVPVLLSPANNLLLTSATVPTDYRPMLSWKAVTVPQGASPFDHYELQVSDKADFSTLLYPSDTVKTDLQVTSFPIPALLLDNQRYYWRLRAHNLNKDFSSWATFSFHTAILKPGLTAPANGKPIHNLRPSFTWTTSEGAASYTLVVSPYANLSSPLLNVTTSLAFYMPVKDLPAAKQLYWRVQANGLNGPSIWTDTWNFTTSVPPSIPVLLSPANNILLSSPAEPPDYLPTLTWKAVTVPAGASPFDHYELQVSDTPAFSTLIYPDSADPADTIEVTNPSFAIPESLLANQSYFWRVRSVNQNGDFSSWAMFSFRTALIRPTLIAPANDPVTPLNNLKPTFSWNSSPGAASYTIIISANSNLSAPVVKATTQNTAYTPGANLPSGKTLYWRVEATGANGPSLWSDTWRFRAK